MTIRHVLIRCTALACLMLPAFAQANDLRPVIEYTCSGTVNATGRIALFSLGDLGIPGTSNAYFGAKFIRATDPTAGTVSLMAMVTKDDLAAPGTDLNRICLASVALHPPQPSTPSLSASLHADPQCALRLPDGQTFNLGQFLTQPAGTSGAASALPEQNCTFRPRLPY